MRVIGESFGVNDSNIQIRGDGFPHVSYMLSHVGVANYMLRGKPTRVLKHPEHFFTDAFLESARSVPVTIEHPPGGWVSLENAKDVDMAGMSVDSPAQRTQDGLGITHSAVLQNSRLVDAIKSRRITQVSAGYKTRFVENSGVFTDSRGVKHEYDAIQTSPTMNHTAFTRSARIKEASIFLDSDTAIWVPPQTEVDNMDEIKELLLTLVNDSKVPDKGAIEALVKALDAKESSLKTLESDLLGAKTQIEALQSKADEEMKAAVDSKVAEMAAKMDSALLIADKCGLDAKELVAMDSKQMLCAGLDKLGVNYDKERSSDYLQGLLEAQSAVQTTRVVDSDTKEKTLQQIILDSHDADLERNRKGIS